MAKRGLIVLVVAWGVLLLAPMFRAQTRKMLGNLSGANQSFCAVRDDWSEIKKANPANAQLAFQELQGRNYPRTPQYWRDLDVLVARFPDDLNLRRARLMESLRPGKLVRVTYWLEKEYPAPAREERSNSRPNSEQRAAMVAAARAGEQQAPDDGFFPWVQAMALWDRNEEPALRALERAAQTSDFDDGATANARALIALRETQTPLEADEKIAIMSGVILPHYAIMREMARQVTWSGIAHYRRGDKAGAYRRWRAILGASAAFRRAQSQGLQSIIIGMLVAEAMEKLIWGDVAEELNPPTKSKVAGAPDSRDNDAAKAARLRAFVELARRDGQNDLANSALRESASFEGRQMSRAISQNFGRLGFESPIELASLEVPWVGRQVFWLSIAGGLALLICLVWRFGVGGAHWFGASGAQIAFFGALWLSALALAWWGRIGYQLRQFTGSTGEATEVSAASLLLTFFENSGAIWPAIAATLVLSIAFCYWQSARETSRLQAQILPQSKAATAGGWRPKLTVFVWIAVALSTVYLFAVGSGTRASVALALWSACAILTLVLSLVRIERGETQNKTRSRLALVGAICGLISLGLSAQFGVSSDNGALYVAAISSLFALAILVFLAVNARDWRPQFARALAVALQTLGGVAAGCAVVFLLTSLAALPVRARQNRVVDDYIARGEIDWMRSQYFISRPTQREQRN